MALSFRGRLLRCFGQRRQYSVGVDRSHLRVALNPRAGNRHGIRVAWASYGAAWRRHGRQGNARQDDSLQCRNRCETPDQRSATADQSHLVSQTMSVSGEHGQYRQSPVRYRGDTAHVQTVLLTGVRNMRQYVGEFVDRRNRQLSRQCDMQRSIHLMRFYHEDSPLGDFYSVAGISPVFPLPLVMGRPWHCSPDLSLNSGLGFGNHIMRLKSWSTWVEPR